MLWRSFLPFDFYAAFFIGAGAAFMILFFAKLQSEKSGLKILIFVFVLAFSLGILRFHLSDKPAPEIFQKEMGNNLALSGIIADQPVEKENNIEIVVETALNRVKTKILFFAEKNGDYRYGDKINYAGKLEKPDNFSTDQGKEFDYVNFLKKDGIFFVMKYPKIEIISRGQGNFLKSALFAVRRNFSGKLDTIMPKPESTVMKGLILGERSSFSQPLKEAFVNTGPIHIVTISGYNVTLVAEWVMKIFGFLPINFAIGAGIFAVISYIIMTGAAASAIRAGIMATLALLAQAIGRIYDSGRALALAGAIMIFINPFILAFDISFQLSFIATVAVIFLAPKLEKYFFWIKWKYIRDTAAITSAAYMFILPFIVYKMGNLSLAALPANLAVLPFIPATMISGFITGLAGFISRQLAFIPGISAYALLHYELAVINFFSGLRFASLAVPDFPLALVILTYGLFVYYLFASDAEPAGQSAFNFAQIQPPEKTGETKARRRDFVFIAAFLVVFIAAGLFSFRYYESNRIAKQKLQALLADASVQAPDPFVSQPRTKSDGCALRGPLPDPECTPGAIFKNANKEQICVRGYTKTVRNVSTKLRKEVFAEYGISYPQPKGAYEVDHLIPLAIGGSNDIANLFPEAALPAPGFHEKDIVEVYLQQEVCAGRVALSAAQRQIASDWLAIYNNLAPEEISAIKKKYSVRKDEAPRQ